VRHGRGVVVSRDGDGNWVGPTFVTVTGGSVGWQAGVQATDVVLVFKTKKSVEGLMEGKFTIGADAAAAAGPVGREASAATDSKLKAEIYSYSRSRGLFAGVSLDGSAMRIDAAATSRYYAPAAGAADGRPQIPQSAVTLLEQIARYTKDGAEGEGAAVLAGPGLAGSALAEPELARAPADEAEAVRRQLAEAATNLAPLLDDTWKRYLALPAEIYGGERQPSAEVLNDTVARFSTVAADPKYRTLSAREEFRQTLALLGKYASLRATERSLNLPPPPQ